MGTYSGYTYANNIVEETKIDLNILSTYRDIYKDVDEIKKRHTVKNEKEISRFN